MTTWHVLVPPSVPADWRWIEPENAHRGWRFRYHEAPDAAVWAAGRDSDAILVTHSCQDAGDCADLVAASDARRDTRRDTRRPPHLAFSFHVPRTFEAQEGLRYRRLAPHIDMFGCHSRFECDYYADQLGLAATRFAAIPWYYEEATTGDKPLIEGRYACAAGGSMRDYATLFSAMAALPDLTLVAVVRRQNLTGLTVPANVRILCDLPQRDLWNVMQHSSVHVVSVPADSRSGHSCLTQGMYFGTPTVVTDAACMREYIRPDQTALTHRAGDRDSLVSAIDTLWQDRARAEELGAAARRFALDHLSKRAMGDRLEPVVRQLHGQVGRESPVRLNAATA